MNDQERLSEALEFASNPTEGANAEHAKEKLGNLESGVEQASVLESLKYNLDELGKGLKVTAENLSKSAKEVGEATIKTGKEVVENVKEVWNYGNALLSIPSEVSWKMRSQKIPIWEAMDQIETGEGDPTREPPPANFRYPGFEYLDTAFKSLISRERREIYQKMTGLAVDVYKNMGENLDDLRLIENKPTWNELMRNRESRGGEAPVLSVLRLQNGPWYNKKDTQEAIMILDLNNGESEDGQSQFIISKAKFKEGVVPPEIESYGMSKAFTSKELEKLLGNSPVFGRQAADRKWLKGEVTDAEYKEMRRGFWGKVVEDRHWDKKYKRPQFLKDWDESFNYGEIVSRDDAERLRNSKKRTVAVETREGVAEMLEEQRSELLSSAAGRTEAAVKKAEIEIEGTLPLGKASALSDRFVRWAQVPMAENPSIEAIQALIDANGVGDVMKADVVFERMQRIKRASLDAIARNNSRSERTRA